MMCNPLFSVSIYFLHLNEGKNEQNILNERSIKIQIFKYNPFQHVGMLNNIFQVVLGYVHYVCRWSGKL